MNPCLPFTTTLDLRSQLPCTDPKSGLRPEMGKKWPNNGFWPHREKRKKWPENGKTGPKKGKHGFLGQFSYFFGHFFPFSRWGQNPFFGHFFPISGRRPDLGSVQGNRDRNSGPKMITHTYIFTIWELIFQSHKTFVKQGCLVLAQHYRHIAQYVTSQRSTPPARCKAPGGILFHTDIYHLWVATAMADSATCYGAQNNDTYTHIFTIWEFISQLHRTSASANYTGFSGRNGRVTRGAFIGTCRERANYTHQLSGN